jgi:hypothetical protein
MCRFDFFLRFRTKASDRTPIDHKSQDPTDHLLLQKPHNLLDLPIEVFHHILAYLTLEDLLIFVLVSKYCHINSQSAIISKYRPVRRRRLQMVTNVFKERKHLAPFLHSFVVSGKDNSSPYRLQERIPQEVYLKDMEAAKCILKDFFELCHNIVYMTMLFDAPLPEVLTEISPPQRPFELIIACHVHQPKSLVFNLLRIKNLKGLALIDPFASYDSFTREYIDLLRLRLEVSRLSLKPPKKSPGPVIDAFLALSQDSVRTLNLSFEDWYYTRNILKSYPTTISRLTTLNLFSNDNKGTPFSFREYFKNDFFLDFKSLQKLSFSFGIMIDCWEDLVDFLNFLPSNLTHFSCSVFFKLGVYIPGQLVSPEQVSSNLEYDFSSFDPFLISKFGEGVGLARFERVVLEKLYHLNLFFKFSWIDFQGNIVLVSDVDVGI